MAAEKPNDWLENFAGRDFENKGGGVDVATVPSNADPSSLLFNQPGNQPSDEEGDDTFIWDESAEVVKKYGQGMWRTDVPVGEKVFRYWGKTRTEVTKQLIQAQQNASKKIQEQTQQLNQNNRQNAPAGPTNRVPDTKLPYDPIPRRATRQLTQDEVLRLQEMEQTDPAQAFRIKLEALTGLSPEGLTQALDKINSAEANRIANEAAFQFVANHPDDWYESKANTDLMAQFLKERNWPATLNNFEMAFYELAYVQKRLTMPPPEESEPPVTPPAMPPAATVEEFTPPPPPVSIPSGSAPSRVQKSEADLVREAAVGIREMPLDEARASLADAFRKARK